jgi:hypothetical protein
MQSGKVSHAYNKQKGDCMQRRFYQLSLPVLAVLGFLAGHPTWGQGKAPDILKVDQNAKVVTVSLTAPEEQSGMSFDGFKRGGMIVQIPLGWKVNVDLKVESSLKHSAVIVPWAERTSSKLTAAFPGAEPERYQVGIGKGQADEKFTFMANKAGQFAIVCGVPGHNAAGMWDELDVKEGLDAPKVLTQG